MKRLATSPLTSEEARQQAEAEGLTLLVADNKAGYHGVHLDQRGKPKPYLAQVWRGGKNVGVVGHEGVNDEGGRSEGRPKRRRSM